MRMKTVGLLAALMMAAAPAVFGIVIPSGIYQLGDHPDGNQRPPLYGLRLDNLIGAGVYTFSFDQPGTSVWMDYDATAGTARIQGRAYGGLDDGISGTWTNPAYFALDFMYSGFVQCDTAGAWNDVCVNASGGGQTAGNDGSIQQLDGGLSPTGPLFVLHDYSDSSGLTFRFGDETNGHRGFDQSNGQSGLSGWGWLTVDNNSHVYSQDWLFTATPVDTPRNPDVPEPATMVLLGTALVGLAARRRFRK